MSGLDEAFLRLPLAHRALHDLAAGRPENSRAAVRAAVAAGYGIEIDIQPSSDGVAIVFHDPTLERLTEETGPVRLRDAETLGRIGLKRGDEGIPTLAQVLAEVDGKVPVLIEIKDQDGAMGTDVGVLEAALARALAGYAGPVAVMSFNPHSVAKMAELAPGIVRGLTTCRFSVENWPSLPAAVRRHLREMPDLARVGASFISHDARDLGSDRVSEVKRAGLAVLCWTIRSVEGETKAREVADNITFEGYLPALPA